MVQRRRERPPSTSLPFSLLLSLSRMKDAMYIATQTLARTRESGYTKLQGTCNRTALISRMARRITQMTVFVRATVFVLHELAVHLHPNCANRIAQHRSSHFTATHLPTKRCAHSSGVARARTTGPLPLQTTVYDGPMTANYG